METVHQRLVSAQLLLSRATLALKDHAEDPSAAALLSAVKGVAQRVVFVDADRNRSEDDVRTLLGDVAAIHARVKEHCAGHQIRYISLDSAPTVVLTASEVLQAVKGMQGGDEIVEAVEAMPERASEPHPNLIERLLEAQLIDHAAHEEIRRRDTLPAPPETLEDLPDHEDGG